MLRRYASCRGGGGGVQLRIYKNHVRYVAAGQVVHSSQHNDYSFFSALSPSSHSNTGQAS